MVNHYQNLHIPLFASPETAKKAYKQLAKKYHPDKNQGSKEAEEQFKKINKAYQVLSNAEKKAQYDQLLRGYIRLRHLSKVSARRYQSFRNKTAFSTASKAHSLMQAVSVIGMFLFISTMMWLFSLISSTISEKKQSEHLRSTGLVMEQVRILNEEQNFEAALKLLSAQEQYMLADSFEVIYQQTISELNQNAEEAYQLNNRTIAYQWLTLLKQYEALEPVTQFQLAELYKHDQNYAKAVNLYLQAANKWSETSAWAYFMIAELYFHQLDNKDRALKYYEQALSSPEMTLSWISEDSIQTGKQLLYSHLSSCYLQSKAYNKLIEQLSRLETTLHYPGYYHQLGYAYCQSGEHEKACLLLQNSDKDELAKACCLYHLQ